MDVPRNPTTKLSPQPPAPPSSMISELGRAGLTGSVLRLVWISVPARLGEASLLFGCLCSGGGFGGEILASPLGGVRAGLSGAGSACGR